MRSALPFACAQDGRTAVSVQSVVHLGYWSFRVDQVNVTLERGMMGKELKLSDIMEVTETDSYKKANKYLKDGWVLLSTRIERKGLGGEKKECTVYCLGRPKSAKRGWGNLL